MDVSFGIIGLYPRPLPGWQHHRLARASPTSVHVRHSGQHNIHIDVLSDRPRPCRHLKPGGRIELSEIRPQILCDDDTFPEDAYARKWTVSASCSPYPHVKIMSIDASLYNRTSSIRSRVKTVLNLTCSRNTLLYSSPPALSMSRLMKSLLLSDRGQRTGDSERLAFLMYISSSRPP